MEIDINLIFNKIKSHYLLESETDLANFLGVSTARLANWRSRNSVNWPMLLTKCKDMDLNLLINERKYEPDWSNFSHKKQNNDLQEELLDAYRTITRLQKEVEQLKNSKRVG